MKKLGISSSSIFDEAQKRFVQSHLAHRLEEKYQEKPFFERYKNLRLATLLLSYTLNLFSIATALSFVLFFVLSLFNNVYFALGISLLSLSFIELLKRNFLPIFFKRGYQFGFKKTSLFVVFGSLVLIAASANLSYFGASKTVQQLSSAPALLDLEQINQEHLGRITALETKQTEIKKSQSWKGTLTKRGQSSFQTIENRITTIEEERLLALAEAKKYNANLVATHQTDTNKQAQVFALLTLSLDLSLILCFWFLEFYDYRSFTEFAHLENPRSDYKQEDNVSEHSATVATPTANPVATEPNAHSFFEATQLAIKKAKANIAAYQSKINNGQGRIETNRRGVERWEEKLRSLETQLALTQQV